MKEQRHLLISSQQKVDKKLEEEDATMGPFLELWEVDGKGIFTKGCWRSADPLH